MLIETSIKARSDKTLRLTTASAKTIVFADDGAGHLVAEVTDPADLAFVLSRSDFAPFDEADFVQAESLIREEAGLDDLPDDEGDEDAAPVEVPKRGKPAKAAK